MAGIAQLPAGPPVALEHLRAALFGADDAREMRPYSEFFDGYPDWSEQTGALNPPRPAPGWRSVQGPERARGRLWGGSGEVLDFLRGTPWWPRPDQFTDRLLLLETSEEAPPPIAVERWLRTFGVCGLFDRLAGLLFGRALGYTSEMRIELEERVLAVVADEFGASNLPIVMDLDFGHTDPQLVLPLGIDAELDVGAQRLRLLEAPLV
jgi:muramoyltetrapeptide carboxypeptidase LdcA involved in peptidoglycan recycling